MSEKGCLKNLIVEDIETNNLTLKGNIKFKGYKFPTIDGANGHILKTDGNSNASWSENIGSLQKDNSTFPFVPAKSNSVSNVLYVDENKSVKIKKNDKIWYTFGEINLSPVFDQNYTPATTYTLDLNGSPTIINVRATDPEGLNIIYSVILQKIVNGVWKTITISDLSNISEIPQLSSITDELIGNIKRYTITPITYNNNGGEFKLIISATDGINITNTSSIFGLNAAEGGIFTTYEADGTTYKVHTFLESGTFTVNTTLTIDFLIVGGGGGGASRHGGGGGAGGVVVGTSQTINSGTFSIDIGGGGNAYTGNGGHASNGSDSSFNLFIASGGGGGSSSQTSNGRDGGSGGGARGNSGKSGGDSNQLPYTNTTNVTGYGEPGGYNSGGAYGGGGGGGAGGNGGNSSSGSNGKNGGVGIQNLFRTGSNAYYGGGGAGGGSSSGGSGGNGGGGNGGGGGSNSSTAGTANTGGGGGAGGHNGGDTNYPGKVGGSGIVVIRYI